MKKKVTTFLFIFISVLINYGQTYFSKTFKFNQFQTEFHNVNVYNNKIFLSLAYTDTVDTNVQVHGLLVLDMNGEVLDTLYKKHNIHTGTYRSETYYIDSNYYILSNAGNTTLLTIFDDYERIDSIPIEDTTNYGYFDYLISSDTSFYFFTTRIGVVNSLDIEVLKLNKNFEFVWKKRYGQTYLHENYVCVIENFKKNLVIGGALINDLNYYYTTILEIDTSGNIVDYYIDTDDDNSFFANGIVQTSDSAYVYVGSYVTERDISSNRYINYVSKLNSNYNKEWELFLGNISSGYNWLQEIEIINDYLYITGVETDSIIPYIFNVLYCISTQGDIVYKKYFVPPNNMLDTIYNNHLYHYHGMDIYNNEIFISSTLGYSFGVVGWLIKTDIYGCLVDSCYPVNDSIYNPPFNISLEPILYPNPSSNEIILNVPTEILGSKISIYSTCGQILYNGIIESEISIFDLTNYANGIYHIQINNANNIIGLKFLKQL